MNYFENCKTIEEVKNQYRKLALRFHPDAGGNNDLMREINLQYDALKNRIFIGKNFKTGEEYEQNFNPYDGFRDIIDKLIRIKDIEIEICGTWIWVTGETKLYKDILKNTGLKYSPKKTAWYWNNGKYRRTGGREYSLEEIRLMYGSDKINQKEGLGIA